MTILKKKVMLSVSKSKLPCFTFQDNSKYTLYTSAATKYQELFFKI